LKQSTHTHTHTKKNSNPFAGRCKGCGPFVGRYKERNHS